MSDFSVINYDLPPRIFPGTTKIVKYSPKGNFTTNMQAGEVVRFGLNDNACLYDPYNTYLEVQFTFSQNVNLQPDPVYSNKIIQLDNSAHSLFSQLLLTHGNNELERIQDYDVINAMLNDVNFCPGNASTRGYEGVGTVHAPSLPNQVLTAYIDPTTNTGNVFGVKYWMPYQSITQFNDTNGRTFALGTSTAAPTYAPASGNFNYPLNHPIVNNRLSFNPLGINDSAVVFSNGTVPSENCNDFTLPAPIGQPSQYGCSQYFTPDFCPTAFEVFFSPTVLQRYMNNGFVKTDFINSGTFFIKIRSGFIGELMPLERYKMLPLWLMPNLTLELTFAQHPFFTSWFSKDQSSRAFMISQLYLHCTLIVPTNDVRNMIEAQYRSPEGIRITSQSFAKGPNQTIQGGAVPATVPINQPFDSMRNLFFLFYPLDYQIATNVRKHKRLSMAITSYQLRVGTEYYPQLAITGNGGNNFGPVNNWEMIKNTFTCFNKHCGPHTSSINPQNFAINCYANDPTLGTGPFFDNTQYALLEENRVVGKAVYGIPCDKLNTNNNILGGINTRNENPFQIELQYNATRTFPRNVMMMIIIHYDSVMVIRPGPGGVNDPEVRTVK